MPTTLIQDLAKFMGQRREGVLAQFTAIVRIDPKISATDLMEKPDVVDHVPDLLESFVEELGQAENGERSEKILQSARLHAKHRWEQFYRIDELLREYAALRQVMMFQVSQFEREKEFEFEDRLRAARTLHDLIDEVIIVAASEFAAQVADAGSMTRPPEEGAT